MGKEQIFKCSDINWKGLETLLAQMGGKARQTEAEDGLILPDLAIIFEHTRHCQDCGGKVLGLAEKYGVDEKKVTQREDEKPTNSQTN